MSTNVLMKTITTFTEKILLKAQDYLIGEKSPDW